MAETRINLIRLEKGSSLGFNIKGGTDKPFKNAKFDNFGIYISTITKK